MTVIQITIVCLLLFSFIVKQLSISRQIECVSGHVTCAAAAAASFQHLCYDVTRENIHKYQQHIVYVNNIVNQVY